MDKIYDILDILESEGNDYGKAHELIDKLEERVKNLKNSGSNHDLDIIYLDISPASYYKIISFSEVTDSGKLLSRHFSILFS